MLSGQYESDPFQPEFMPRSLCGGTYRSSRRRKRKRKGDTAEPKKTLTHAEKAQRRIEKKFGTNGVKLGDDEETRVKLEKGKKVKGKPRVAQSVRGRELRAAAALARFGQQKEEELMIEKEENVETESESETGSEYENSDDKNEAAKDLDGSIMVDSKGHGMVRVCKGEDGHDAHIKQEMQELQELNQTTIPPHQQPCRTLQTRQENNQQSRPRSNAGSRRDMPLEERSLHDIPAYKEPPKPKPLLPKTQSTPRPEVHRPPPLPPVARAPSGIACLICTTFNSSFNAPICTTCSHVLDKSRVPGHWQCQSEGCNADYVNVSDLRICGLCGTRRSSG